MFQKSLIIYCFIYLLLAISIEAKQQLIQLESFLEKTSESHPYMQQLNAQNKVSKKLSKAAKGSQDWRFNQSLSYLYNEPISIGISFYDRNEQSIAASTFSKNLWSTGGTFSIGNQTQYFEQKQSSLFQSFGGNSPTSFYQNQLFIEYRQPLWKNLGGTLFQHEFNIAYYNQKIQNLVTEENKENFLKNLSLHFIQWAYLHHSLDLANKRVQLAEESFIQSKKRFNANLVNKVDLIRAETALNTTKIDALNAKANVEAKTQELQQISFFEGLDQYTPQFDFFKLEKIDAIPNAEALLKSRPLKITTIEIQKSQQNQKLYKENMKPDIGLTLFGAKDDANQAFKDLIELNNDTFRVSLDYQVPFGKTTDKNNLKASEQQLLALESQKAYQFAQLKAQKEILLTQLKYLKQRIQLSQKQLSLAKALSKEEMRLYLQGKNPIFQTIQAQDAEQRQKIIYANYVFAYHQNYLELKALLDIL